MNEVNELLDKLEKLENAPLIWVNKKVYDTSKEIERLNNQLQQKENIIKEVREYIEEWQNFPHTNGSTYKELANIIGILDKGEMENE